MRIDRGKLKGFTLISLITVLVIIAILAASSVALMPSSSRVKASAFIDTFASDIRLTRILAVSKDISYKMVINNNSYQILDANNQIFSFPDGSQTISFPADFSVTPASTTLTFNTLGQPMDGANIKSSDTSLVTNVSSTVRTITIYGQTGYIHEQS